MKNTPEQVAQIKKLREETGWGIMDIKKAMEESNFDEEKARDILKSIRLPFLSDVPVKP
jgi:translation elongation factor EF-Ts